MKLKKSISKLLSFVVAVSMILPTIVLADGAPTISVQSVAGIAGNTVNVPIVINNNTGILGATLKITYDSNLILTNATSGSAFSHMTMTKPGNYASPCNFVWDGQDLDPSDIKDGEVLNLSFLIDADAPSDTECSVKVSYNSGDIVDGSLKPVSVDTENGYVSVISYTPGDLNTDSKVNSTDIIMLRRQIAGKYEQTVNELAGDVNADGNLNTVDIITMRRYIADGCKKDPNGYNVELLPGKPKEEICEHAAYEVAYKAPTCTVAGNIEYWHCTKCDKLFSDEACTKEITVSETIITATGHTVVIDSAVAPTYDTTGLTEGSHCSVCGAVINAQTVVPKLEKTEYSILYHIIDNDDYLSSITIDNPNPSIYATEDGLTLQNLNVVGYNFLGWYTMQSGGTQVTEIEKGTTGNKELYARWEPIEYTVQFKCDMVPQETQTYTVGVEKVLPTPQLDKYTFVGWADEKNNIWKNIPAGSTGNLVLYANWSSDRNKAVAKKSLSDPVICKDIDDGLIMFTYELGTIENVPLYTMSEILAANGLKTIVTTTTTGTVSTSTANTVAQTVADAVTNSNTWTLSNDWNDTTEVSEKYIEENSTTREEAETKAKSSTGTYCVGYSSGGSSTSSSTSGSTYAYSNNDAHNRSYSNETMDSVETTVDHNFKAGIEASVPVKVATLKGSVSYEYDNNKTTKNYTDSKDSGTDDWSSSESGSEYSSNTSTSAKSWNSSSSYSNSNTTSSSSSISTAVSEMISNEYGYGSSYSKGGSNSESQAFASTQSTSEEYSSTLTYYTSEINTQSTTYETTGNTHGSYRIVCAGTVHVFGTVVYDVATKEYYLYTFNIMGDGSSNDAPKAYLDYSYDGTFNDYQNSLIPFEIPYEINEYVNGKIAKTDGIKMGTNGDFVQSYSDTNSDGTEEIYIPSFNSIDNGDGTYEFKKVTGVNKELFKNNTSIKAVSLGDYITEIPDGMFEGCENLEYVYCPNVTSIGANAFKGCVKLKTFTIPTQITSVGENAFEGVSNIVAYASSLDVAKSVGESGAQNIVLNIASIPMDEIDGVELNIAEIESFELQGGDKEYKGLSIVSNAITTIINGVTFTENTKIPMELSSSNVTLNRVTVNATGFAMVLKADETNLTLNRAVNLISKNDDVVLSKTLTLSELSTEIAGALNVTGNVLVSGTLDGEALLTVDDNHEVKYITDEEFDNYLSSHTISFDANGGEMEETTKLCPVNSAIGELPTPTRDYYTFEGWYTDPDEGDEVTAETLMTSLVDITLYAHWVQNDVSAWVLASEAPEDAEIVATNYKYNLTSYTTSSSSSLSGWTNYKSTWVWSDYGAWSGWQDSSITGSDYRQVESQHVYRYYNYTCSNSSCWLHKVPCYTKCPNCGSYVDEGTWWEYWATTPYTYWWDNDKAANYYKSNNGTRCYTTWLNGEYTWWEPSEYAQKDQYRYRDRSKIFTYYFKKTESKESSTYPTGDNISNIQEYVQYRAK